MRKAPELITPEWEAASPAFCTTLAKLQLDEVLEQLFEIMQAAARAASATAAFEGNRRTAQEQWDTAWDAEEQWQAAMLRDMFRNPFQPASALPHAYRQWNDGLVVSIARKIEMERTVDHFPILADALEDSGCHNAAILNHCREPGIHVRGCWVIDLLLGKE
jgi:hypothetical protein